MTELNFCPDCGAHLKERVVAGESRNHHYCTCCNQCVYDSPQVVVTCFVAHKNRLLWVQRDLPPQRGLWAIPGGFLENSETLAEGAARELREEAGVVIPADRMQLYMTGTITFMNQIYVAFRATVDSDAVSSGVESQDCQFFARHECPWDEVAYPQVNDSIRQAYQDLDDGEFQVWQAEMTKDRYQLQPVLTRRY